MSTLNLENRKLQVYWGPQEDGSPGALKHGGYCDRNPVRNTTNYRMAGPNSGGATVEVVEHHNSYLYVVHDLMGCIRTAAGYFIPSNSAARPRSGDSQDAHPEKNISFVEWNKIPGSGEHIIICVEAEDPTNFAAAWYSETGGKQTTVIIRCNALPGWPVSVINEYLAKYPSALRADRSLVEEWEAADLAKWKDILRTRRNDEIVLSVAATQLMSYGDQQAFGIIEAMRHKNDPALLGPELDKVITNIESFVREHPEYHVKERPKTNAQQP